MTPEKRRTFLWVGTALILGVLIGAFSSRIFAHHSFHGHRGHHGKKGHDRQSITLADRIFKAIDADSSQRKLMRPIIEQAGARINNTGREHRENRHQMLDSLKIKLRPMLREEQAKKLDEFAAKRGKSSKRGS
jgi:hypothetical protein